MKIIVGAIAVLYAAASTFAADGGSRIASIDAAHRDTPNLTVREATEYYEIFGARIEALRQEICDKGCRISNGRTYDSITNWRVKWDFGHKKGPQACKATDFRVNVSITFRYPEWIRPDDASRELVGKWEAYLNRLIAHEEGHRDLAVEAADDLIRVVEKLPGAPTCDELDRTIRALSRDRMKKMAEDQKRYDAVTGHGSSQGALLQ